MWMRITLLITLLLLLSPAMVWASAGGERLDLTASWVGFAALAIFVVAYALVMAEEFTHLRKSKPVILAAGVIWAMIAIVYAGHGLTHAAEMAVGSVVSEFVGV